MVPDISLTDYLAMRNLAFEWSESYDKKDWPRLRAILAPSVRLDYRSVTGQLHESLTPDEFVTELSNPKILGNKCLKTQHFIGAQKWAVLDDGSVQVDNQIRAAHQLYASEDLKEVVNKGHGIGVTQHVYKKVEGTWLIAEVTPKLDWFEYDLFGTLNPPQ